MTGQTMGGQLVTGWTMGGQLTGTWLSLRCSGSHSVDFLSEERVKPHFPPTPLLAPATSKAQFSKVFATQLSHTGSQFLSSRPPSAPTLWFTLDTPIKAKLEFLVSQMELGLFGAVYRDQMTSVIIKFLPSSLFVRFHSQPPPFYCVRGCIIVLSAQLQTVCHIFPNCFNDISFGLGSAKPSLPLISLQDIGKPEGCWKSKLSTGAIWNISTTLIMTAWGERGQYV